LLMNLKRARYLTMQQVNDLNIKVSNINQEIASLSGGNQQKALIGRWLTVSPKILVVDEPTRGVDVGAKAEIHKLLRKLADEGMAIILISSELLEILGMSDRIITVWQGQITNCMINDHITEQDIVRYIYGERGQAVNE
jgi:ribose transport system ATP-binding protein